MSNQIIKDFKGWNLLTEDTDMKAPIPSNSPLNNPTANLNFSNPIPGVTPPTAEPTPPTPAKPAATKVKAAPPVPTADLKTAKDGALTRNDWAAIQTELNRSGILADKAAVVTESRHKLYEALLTVDGIPGSKTLAAVKLYLDTFNAKNKSGIKIGTDVPITAQSIGSELLAALATKQVNTGSPDSQKAATSTTDTTTVAPTDSTTPAGKMTLAAAKAAVVIMQKIRDAAGGPGTDDELFITSITTPTTADDFYNLNAILKKEYGMTIAEIINDEFGTDDLKYAKRIKTYLDGLKIESSFTSSKGAMSYENTENNIFTEDSFKITIPTGKEPDTLYPAITNRNELYS
jgi:hypothetical protein